METEKVNNIYLIRLCLTCLIIILISIVIKPQTKRDSVWKTIIEKDGLNVSFIHYSKADNYNNGIVIKLWNKNNYPVGYKFDLIFKSDTIEQVQEMQGILKHNQIRVGSSDSLFFIPFKDQKPISEVGIRGFKTYKR